MKIIEIQRKFKKAYKNYISVLWGVWRRKKRIKIILKDGSLHHVGFDLAYLIAILIDNPHITDLELYKEGLKFTYKDKGVRMVGVGDFPAVFGLEDYNFLSVEGKIVIDVGANVGDSALYFALNNATKVIALEPYPYSYNSALKNVKLNNLEDKISILNAGYGKEGVVKIDSDFKNTISSDLKISDKGTEVQILSLKKILKDNNIDDAILKMDCEGCEYNLINEDNDTLRKFKMMQIEYHYGYEKLKTKLEGAGFTVTYTEPRTYLNKDAEEHKMSLGYIYAKLDSSMELTT